MSASASSPLRADVIVIGAGSTGTNVAGYARDNDLSCIMVEAELVGGSCSYWACIPSKALLTAPAALAAARRLPGAAEALSGEVDVGAVFARRDEMVSHLDDASQVDWVESTGAHLLRGRARLDGVRRVVVECDGRPPIELFADRAVVVATGSSPMLPPIEGLADARPWTNREATSTEVVPRRLAVIGGGVVGCELGQAFARLGAEQVIIVESSERVLDGYAPRVSEVVSDALEDDGVVIHSGLSVDGVSRNGDGTVRLRAGDTSIDADEVLVATGRRPATGDLGLDRIGLDAAAGEFLTVDALLRVAGAEDNSGATGWLYAVGDVNGRALLTHQGKYQARCVADTIAGKPTPAVADEGVVPQVVFTDPPVAAVGLSSVDADPELHSVITVPAGSVAAASLAGDPRGCAEVVIDREAGRVLGATFACHGADELLHAATVAIVSGIAIDELWHCVPAFPTMSELWLRLLEAHRGI